MTTTATEFAGFPAATRRFLRKVRQNNDRNWFAAHREEYVRAYVEPARAFVRALEPHLRKLVPALVIDARINGSIRRIQRDSRFVRDGAPFKDHLGFSFWEHGPQRGMSALFVRFSPEAFAVGCGFRGQDSTRLRALRSTLTQPRRRQELARVAQRLRRHGYEIGGRRYERPPKTLEVRGPGSEFALHAALFVIDEQKPRLAQSANLIDHCLQHWRRSLPLHRWLNDRVAFDD
ncbi:MAG: DUF2461 domain-containing protein [bacterium]|nr:DUF2461 domain-containing protein [bacterium]